jgi:uncharacterized protein YecT (DUF1311 family)
MKRVPYIVVTAVSSLALWATLAYAAGGPPVIKEPFTPLPCPAHPSTTLALEGCAEKAILKTDAKINAQAKTIYAKLRTAGGKASFVRGEKSWLSYRRSSCSAQASKYTGGTFEPVAYARCEASRNLSHIGDLKQLTAALRP